VRIHPAKIPKTVTHVPLKHQKTFFYTSKKIDHPVVRAYRSRGWIQVDDMDHAHWIYTYDANGEFGLHLKQWQRFNLLPDYQKWNNKAQFTHYYNLFQRQTGRVSQYVPQTFILSDSEEEALQFQTVLEEQGGAKYPWVLKEGLVNQVSTQTLSQRSSFSGRYKVPFIRPCREGSSLSDWSFL
jgi:hypothetical protein